jgi:hypothetical protein
VGVVGGGSADIPHILGDRGVFHEDKSAFGATKERGSEWYIGSNFTASLDFSSIQSLQVIVLLL